MLNFSQPDNARKRATDRRTLRSSSRLPPGGQEQALLPTERVATQPRVPHHKFSFSSFRVTRAQFSFFYQALTSDLPQDLIFVRYIRASSTIFGADLKPYAVKVEPVLARECARAEHLPVLARQSFGIGKTSTEYRRKLLQLICLDVTKLHNA